MIGLKKRYSSLLKKINIKSLSFFWHQNKVKPFFWLIILVVFFTGLRLVRLGQPATFYFDEIYHISAAELISKNDPRAYEWWHQAVKSVGGYFAHDWLHPPLFKLIQAGFMKVFGVKSWAWRLPSVLSAAGLSVATYWLAKNSWLLIGRSSFLDLGRKKKDLIKQAEQIALLAAFLLNLSGLIFVQSRIGMNDIGVSLFITLALGCYVKFVEVLLLNKKSKNKEKKTKILLRKWLSRTGLFFSLALATKWSALFLWLPLTASNLGLLAHKKNKKILIYGVLFLLFMPLGFYLLSYGQMFFQGKGLKDFFELHRQIIWYQLNRDSLHAYDSGPLQWFFNLRPVWYWKNANLEQSKTGNIYLLENLGLSWLAMPSLLLGIASTNKIFNQAKKNKKKFKIFIFWLLILGSYALLFLPWILSPRISFYYHYLPALPLLMILIAYFLMWLRSMSKWSFRFLMLSIIFCFLVFYPHWTGITVSKTWADAIYFSLSSWK